MGDSAIRVLLRISAAMEDIRKEQLINGTLKIVVDNRS